VSYADIYVHKAEDIPQREHWAIITSSSVHVPAAGVWAPGHGYPEHDEKYVEYAAYFDEEAFKAELARQSTNSYRTVRGIHVSKTYTTRTVTEAVATPK
jgi:hypothetical protein